MKIRKFRRKKTTFARIKSFFAWWTWRRLFWSGATSAVLLGGGLFLYTVYVLPPVDGAAELRFAESTIIYDRSALEPGANPDDHILYVIHGDENREYVPLEEISPAIVKATLAIEDDQFYHHWGFDLGGIVKATLNHFFGIGTTRGGSTITQQLIKNTFLSHERTVTRKLNELLLSLKLEALYSKDDILEMYLNVIPYGHNAFGVEAAARTFFGKSARDITLPEATVLASLPVAPTRFSPYGSNRDLLMGYHEYDERTGERVYRKGRKDLVLQRMLDEKLITFDEFQTAWSQSQNLVFRQERVDINAPHFVFLVRQMLEDKFGKDFLRQGGLRIYTSLDPELQSVAEELVAENIDVYRTTYGAGNGALMALDTDTGEILAYVGGADYFDTEHDGQVDVLQSYRQPGSSFKPVVYAAGFDEGYSPSTVLFDTETDFGGNYTPENFDGEYKGPVSVREALNASLNIPAIKMAYLATPKKVIEMAKNLGIDLVGNAEQHGVAIGIGVAEVRPASHISAYQAFAGDGSYHAPTAILRVEDAGGAILEEADIEKQKREGLDPEVAALVRNILTDESTRPTTDDFDWNTFLQLGSYNNGAKTGTSNRRATNPDFNPDEPESEENPLEITVPSDSWTIGFTPHLVAGVWVGNNRGEPMRPGATGMAVAAPIWKKFMTRAHDILVERGADPDKLYNEPKPLELRNVNRFSGKIATAFTPTSLVRQEVFASFAVPTDLDDSVQKVVMDALTGQRATPYTPPYAREEKFVLQLQSIRPKLPNWQNPVQEWLAEHPEFLTSLGAVMDGEPLVDEPPATSSDIPGETNTAPRTPAQNVVDSGVPPQIEIITPRDKGTIASGTVEVRVDTLSRTGMRMVEFYLDGVLMQEVSLHPYTGVIPIPPDIDPGKHTIRAVAIDRAGRWAEAEITVSIAPDERGPEVIFLGPVGNQRLPLNSAVQVLSQVNDFESGVRQVEFFLDDATIGIDTTPPYQSTFETGTESGRHRLSIKAWDHHGNLTEKSIPVLFTESEEAMSPEELTITDIVPYRSSVSVQVFVPEPESAEWADLIVRQGGEIIDSARIERPQENLQFQVGKGTHRGAVTLQMFVKRAGVEELDSSRVHKINF